MTGLHWELPLGVAGTDPPIKRVKNSHLLQVARYHEARVWGRHLSTVSYDWGKLGEASGCTSNFCDADGKKIIES